MIEHRRKEHSWQNFADPILSAYRCATSLPRAHSTRREILGFTVDQRFDAPDFVLFDTNSIPFALSAAKVNPDEVSQPGRGMTLWIDCDHVNELHATLEAQGTTIITPPYDSPFGHAFVFADPDGYRITVNENPWDRFPLGGRQL